MGCEIHAMSKWRRRLWPFHSFEMKKLIPLILMKFFISVNYCIFTSIKDASVITGSGAGAEVIPVLKGWLVLPCSILGALIYSKLSRVVKKSTLFCGTIGVFIVLSLLIGLLFPYADQVSPHQSAKWLLDFVGPRHAHWVAVYHHWLPSLLFVTAELWGAMAIMVLFWGFANAITNNEESKRCYSLYIAAGDVALITVGSFTHIAKKLGFMSNFSENVSSLMYCTTIISLIVIALYLYMQKHVLNDPRYYKPEMPKAQIKKGPKPSLRDSFRYILKSGAFTRLAIIVIGYSLAITLIEVTWKATARELYPSSSDYHHFTANMQLWVGIIAFITSVFFGTNIMRKFGWRLSAQITPIVVGITGLIFLVLTYFRNDLASMLGSPIAVLTLLVTLGAIQNVASKVSKYAFFDSTKEIAYVNLPMESTLKLQGKAAIDVIAARLGKSGSSWIQVALIDFVGMGSIFGVIHYLIPIMLVMVVFWIYSVHTLPNYFGIQEKERISPQTI